MKLRRIATLGLAAGALLAGCDDPVGPPAEIAGEYELTARVDNAVEVPLAPSDDGARLVLRPDRTWVLTRHRGPRVDQVSGFGLTDRYRLVPLEGAFELRMFGESSTLAALAGVARVRHDTLTWGSEVFVRR